MADGAAESNFALLVAAWTSPSQIVYRSDLVAHVLQPAHTQLRFLKLPLILHGNLLRNLLLHHFLEGFEADFAVVVRVDVFYHLLNDCVAHPPIVGEHTLQFLV